MAPSVCIHASELAACIGQNPYKPRAELLNEYARRYGGKDVVATLPPSAQETADAALKAWREADPAAYAKCIEHISATPLNTPGDVGACVQRALEAVSSTSALPDNVTPVLQELVRSSVFTRYGTEQEDGVRLRLPQATEKTDKYVKRRVGLVDGIEVFVGGKCDGIADDGAGGKKVVEIKNRVKRLFKRVVDYERVQLLAYMFIHGVGNGELVERYGETTHTHGIVFEEREWGVISAEALQFVRDLAAHAFLSKPKIP